MSTIPEKLKQDRSPVGHFRCLLMALFLLVAGSLHGQTVQNPHGALNLDCVVCHSTDNWSKMRPDLKFNHAKTDFPLDGRHAAVSCRSCHKSLEFSKAATTCSGCHQDVHANQFGDACSRCHSPQTWTDESRFRQMHQDTRFPLAGSHGALDCERCHAKGQYADAPQDCYGCHFETYSATTDPDHRGAGFSLDCQQCHSLSAASWTSRLGAYNHTSNFPLIGGHNISGCSVCHQAGTNYKQTSTDCYTCHQNTYQSTTNPNHVAGNFGTNCTICHNIMGWSPAQFDHNLSNFPLTGAHQSLTCNDCHAQGYSNTSPACVSCHQAAFQSAANPIHTSPSFSDVCTECHNTAAWSPSSFNHNTQTNYTLTGAHQTVNCASCHANGVYTGTSTVCYTCHLQDFNGTQDPNHVAQSFPTQCEVCHSTTNWTQSTFDHSQTTFPLTGAHSTLNCVACHSQGYTNTPTACYACHQTNYSQANPVHNLPAFDHVCTVCHTTAVWTPSTFNHSTQTTYPLTGSHATVACVNCHANGVYVGTSTLCYTCHQQDFIGTQDPNHVAQGFPTQCDLCHVTAGWSPATFDHNQSSFPLTGAHATLACVACHSQGYTNTPTACYACHQTNYNQANNPLHNPGLSQTCTSCHTTTAWTPSTFNHTSTGFTLEGAHLTATCVSCHPGGVYVGTPTDCYTCHQTSYNQAVPIHDLPSFVHDCTVCHTMTGWVPSTFNHSTQTTWPLTGTHITTSCASCHANGVYQGTSTLCYSCHQQDYQNALDPNHVQLNYSHSCETCHNTTSWDQTTFNHDQTAFPLTGAHVGLNCLACHSQGYSGTPTACYACHQTNYSQAIPIHNLPAFDHVCTVCHTTAVWTPSTFNHSTQTTYPLTGSHATVACVNCHANGVYVGTSTLCYTCHQQDYINVQDPNHVTQNYPTQCEICHVTTAWNQVTFNHDQTSFPLTGAHIGLNCLACHSQGYSGTPTACYACHQTNYSQANPIHTPPSFSYVCTGCHTTAAWLPSSFNHNTQTSFVLTGAHLTATCVSCHPGGVYTGTPTDCYTCHQTNYNQANPIHNLPSFSHVCTVCHTTMGWVPSSFNHSTQTTWPLTGAHVNTACNLCHVGGQYPGTPTVCYFCHQAEYQGTTNPNHIQAGFPTACEVCHTTITWQGATFNHNQYFPIGPGSHHNNISCTECHIGGIYNSFSCIDCHEHSNQSQVNQQHQEVPNYVYLSSACYACHPTGGGGGDARRHLRRTDSPERRNP